ncbi:hypothetical protein BD289DRAFT_485502 [Coniella lustricola]|uniref:Leucine-rich repeat-containing protein 40 n=1 Tax=Coniella lustricola TaxID=2025994 RepID=A0A2T2ZYH4_9PEZI|nr:hypothetical protein BD289DRAFT_485502 [Coniella lustricola]
MEEHRPVGGKTGLPRPMSRLPAPKPANTIRRSASKPSLTALPPPPAAASEQSELRAPRLRPAASRERLSSAPSLGKSSFGSIPTPAAATTARPAPSSSSSSISSTARTLSRPRPVSSLPTAHSQPSIPRLSGVGNNFSRPPRDQLSSLPEQESSSDRQPSSSSSASTKLPGLRKRPSSQWISAAQSSRTRTPSISNATSDSVSGDAPSHTDAVDERAARNKSRSRPSLAERTMETLSHLSPAPPLRAKASSSNFFELDPLAGNSRPTSRRASRPPSSLRSESSNPSQRRALSRPGSSCGPGPGQGNNHNGMLMSSPLGPHTSSIDESSARGRTVGTRMRTPSKTGAPRNLRSQLAMPSSMRLPRSRTPSIDNSSADPMSPIASEETASRPLQLRPSPNPVFKKPTAPAIKKPVPLSLTPRKGSITSLKSSATASGEDATFSTSSPKSSQTALSAAESPPQFKKSSAALREQIARAKAAKRVGTQETSSQHNAPSHGKGSDMPVIPTDTTFDFGLSDNPFNLKRDAASASKVLQTRVAAARTSGRLNIAALGLKEIPSEVKNMYSLESIGGNDGSWAESVDLTRFVAADNELEMIDESLFPDVALEELAEDDDFEGLLFGGLETLDLHGNMLISLPPGLRRLTLLTSLNLSSNRLANNCLDTISQIKALRDLKLGGNLLWGTLEPDFGRLANLEIIDLHGNNLQALPPSFAELRRLRILNLAENNFETLPFDILSKLPLTELNARKNKLSGVLVQDGTETMPTLQTLDVSSNQLTAISRPNNALSMPALTQLCVSMNRIQALPDVSSWLELTTLAADENSINAFPDGFADLHMLRHADLSSNDIRTIPAEVARMARLTMLRLSGNPLRDRKFVTASMEELKEMLEARLQPPSAALDGKFDMDTDGSEGLIAEAITSDEANVLEPAFGPGVSRSQSWGSGYGSQHQQQQQQQQDDEDNRTDTDDFATPPTSMPGSPPVPPPQAQSTPGVPSWFG